MFPFPLESASVLANLPGGVQILTRDLPALASLAPPAWMTDLMVNGLVWAETLYQQRDGVALLDSCVMETVVRALAQRDDERARKCLRALVRDKTAGKHSDWNFARLLAPLERVIMVLNPDGAHWTVAELQLRPAASLVYYDPFHNPRDVPCQVVRVAKFILRLRRSFEEEVRHMRRSCHAFAPAQQQLDGHSCGAYAYVIAAALLARRPLDTISLADVDDARRDALFDLFQASRDPTYDTEALQADPLYRALERHVYERARAFACPLTDCAATFADMRGLQGHLRAVHCR